MKIFVSIVSYRDPLLHQTIRNMMEMQSQLTKVTYGIFEQTDYPDSLEAKHPDLAQNKNVRYKRIDAKHSDGVGWGRHINSIQVTDEEFYYQVDSHMLFDKNWDRYLISDFKLGMQQHQTDRIIIDANCGSFRMQDDGTPWIDRHGAITVKAGYWSFHENYILGAHGEFRESTTDFLHPTIHLFAGNFFTHTDWIRNVGMNPRIFFEGEEQYMTLASLNAGYKLCAPRQIHCYHLIDTHRYVTKQDINQVVSHEQLTRNREKSKKEFQNFLDSLSDEFFEEYRKYSGVDYINRKLENRAISRSILLPPDVVNDWEIPDRYD